MAVPGLCTGMARYSIVDNACNCLAQGSDCASWPRQLQVAAACVYLGSACGSSGHHLSCRQSQRFPSKMLSQCFLTVETSATSDRSHDLCKLRLTMRFVQALYWKWACLRKAGSHGLPAYAVASTSSIRALAACSSSREISASGWRTSQIQRLLRVQQGMLLPPLCLLLELAP